MNSIIKFQYINTMMLMAAISLFLFGCVPARQVEEIKENYAKCNDERVQLSSQNQTLETKNTELQAHVDKMVRAIGGLESDTTVMGEAVRQMERQYDKINKLNDQLLAKSSQMAAGSAAESRRLLEELQRSQLDIQSGQDNLKVLERKLDDKKKELELKQAELLKERTSLEVLNEELRKREERVNELESIIAHKDEAVNALKNKISDALLGFADKGLTVEEKGGRIYVSMEAKLLFGSGSTAVDAGGNDALKALAKAIEGQEDIHIMVEGHTDSDKLGGNGALKDNWDLSVMRATSVTRILLANGKIDPLNITAAGRGEFMPLDEADTKEAKAKNRRIEVILTPNLDKLFELLNSSELPVTE